MNTDQKKEDWEYSADERFTSYYEEESLSEATVTRSVTLMAKILRFMSVTGISRDVLAVGDIGCGPGAQASVWAEKGHSVSAIDINSEFIEIGKRRAQEQGQQIKFDVGSATELPWESETMDVCLLPELLEHVEDWRSCLDEAVRVLKKNGVLYLSTSNKLCPVQHEFQLPLYSWYPERLKKRYEKLSVTTRPELVNFAAYPAVNWFSLYSLRKSLSQRGMRVHSKFRFNALTAQSQSRRMINALIDSTPPTAFLGQVVTPYTLVIGVKG